MTDVRNVAAGFILLIPALWVLGRAIGFLTPFHMPVAAAPRIAGQFLIIFVATALPEEILLRGFIQNSLMRKLGSSWRTLLAAALIFGEAHLDNGPQPLPNWRYFILASIAGAAYGWVFEESSSILAPAALHALTDTMKHVCF